MSEKIHIAVDAMGGDLGPRLCVLASQKFLRDVGDARITLVGDEAVIRPFVSPHLPQLEIVHTSVSVDMADRPSSALRHKSDSSMARAIELVAEKLALGCVSSGNTGALMGFGVRHLGMVSGVERPAICKALPADGARCWVSDLGAAVECTAEQLLQYAQMTNVIAKQEGVTNPRIAIINVGTEATKGKSLQQKAAKLFADFFPDQYIGFIESGDIFRGQADIAICDGFTGNVMLKASEGATELLQRSLDRTFQQGRFGRLGSGVLKPFLSAWRREYNLSRFNGAMFLGLGAVVVKSHGAASEEGFCSALMVAYEQIKNNTIQVIQQGLNN